MHTRPTVFKPLTAILLALCAASSATADEWINLFDNETLFGLTPFGDCPWTVNQGMLVCDGGSGGWIATTSQFADFELAAEIRIAPEGSAGIVFRAGLEGHPSENGSSTVLISEPKSEKPEWRQVNITANGTEISATVDGKPAEILGGGRARGYIGIQYHRTGRIEVAGLRLRPLNTKPLFNGKDLDGWNVIPDHKSVFTVLDGAINIKNGNGQIETAKVFKDFVLQLDIFSNGDHLNSGVFFRGPVGVFWKGYESQVRNEWRKDIRTQPVDFGTGGNYGNQAARKVVSSDREWFTKTIVCDGNHAAVWINGYLVSDYLDERPVSTESNGKAGYVPGPGTIHLQGHDPTTDLSFRNIVIQEYPPAK